MLYSWHKDMMRTLSLEDLIEVAACATELRAEREAQLVPLSEAELMQLAQHQLVPAIRDYRARTDCKLVDAKNFVTAVYRRDFRGDR